jgi:hypothetical protein
MQTFDLKGQPPSNYILMRLDRMSVGSLSRLARQPILARIVAAGAVVGTAYALLRGDYKQAIVISAAGWPLFILWGVVIATVERLSEKLSGSRKQRR